MAQAIRRLADPACAGEPIDVVAAELGLSRAHFQRLFHDYVGLSPHRYRQHCQLQAAKASLRAGASVLEAALAHGFSGPGRLHATQVEFESFSPGEYKRGELPLQWGTHTTLFGPCLLAISARGVAALFFLPDSGDTTAALADLQAQYPEAVLQAAPEATAPFAERLFAPSAGGHPWRVRVRGTNFQVQVWRALLRIPPGQCVSYQHLASAMGKPGASRAVGQAVGANPVSWLIPCHRVLRADGALSGYRWGPDCKRRLLAWESAQVAPIEQSELVR